MESKFLDGVGLSRLVENIKNTFQKKKIVCTIWDENGDMENPMWGCDIVTSNKSYSDLYINSSGDLIYSILHNHIYELEFYYKDTRVTPITYTKINYQIIQDTEERLEIVFTIPLMFNSLDHFVEVITIGFGFEKGNDVGYWEQNIPESNFLPDDLYKVSSILNSYDDSNKVLTGNLDYAIVPKVIEIDIDNKYIITPSELKYRLEQTSTSLYNELKVLYDTKCPIQILINRYDAKLTATNTYIDHFNKTITLRFTYNEFHIDWEEVPERRPIRLNGPQVIGVINIKSTGSITYELINENIKLIGDGCSIELYKDEPKTIYFSGSRENICFDKDDSNYVAGNALKIIENFRRINIMGQDNGVNFSINGLDSIYDTIQSDNNNVLVNYFMSGDDDNLHNYTFVIFTQEINTSNQNSPTPCIYYFNLFIDSNDPDNSITYEIKRLYYTTPIPLTDKGNGTKYLNDKGEYEEIPKKTHCKLFDDGGYWTIAINDSNEYEIVRDGAALYDVLKDKLDNLTFDIEFDNTYSLYDVNYNIQKDDDKTINIIITGLTYSSSDEPLTDIIKVGIWLGEGEEGDCIISKGTDININNLNIINNLDKSGDGTKFLANDGQYKDIKGHDKVYYGSYDYFATDGGGASQEIRDEAKELLLEGKNVIIYDDSIGALYNVGYISNDEFIFKISGYNPQLGYILIDIVDFGDIYANNIIKIFSEKGDGTKYLNDKGEYEEINILQIANGDIDQIISENW